MNLALTIGKLHGFLGTFLFDTDHGAVRKYALFGA